MTQHVITNAGGIIQGSTAVSEAQILALQSTVEARVLSFEEARAWRKLSGDYVRNRQWNDIEVDIRII